MKMKNGALAAAALIFVSAFAMVSDSGVVRGLVAFLVAVCSAALFLIVLKAKWESDGRAAKKLGDVPDGDYVILRYLKSGNDTCVMLRKSSSRELYACPTGNMKRFPVGEKVNKKGNDIKQA